MCWNKGRLCWKIAKLFYFSHLKKLDRLETFGPYYVHTAVSSLTINNWIQFHFSPKLPIESPPKIFTFSTESPCIMNTNSLYKYRRKSLHAVHTLSLCGKLYIQFRLWTPDGRVYRKQSEIMKYVMHISVYIGDLTARSLGGRLF